MVKGRLIDIAIVAKKKALFDPHFGTKGGRWYASIALNLVDESTGRSLSEWFYLIVCSRSYITKPFRSGPVLSEVYTVVQDSFDLESVQAIAKRRLESVQATDWPDFYRQMSRHFLHED